ncbi:MAG: hypothetical protein EHM79_02535 [Geobacter sp.]|nr:MAG: hypothetical protein EHM79_02535 [Geobacter sp.]
MRRTVGRKLIQGREVSRVSAQKLKQTPPFSGKVCRIKHRKVPSRRMASHMVVSNGGIVVPLEGAEGQICRDKYKVR